MSEIKNCRLSLYGKVQQFEELGFKRLTLSVWQFGASEVTTLWRDRNVYIIIIIINLFFIPQVVKKHGVKN